MVNVWCHCLYHPTAQRCFEDLGVVSARVEVGSALGSPHPSHGWASRAGGVAAGFGSTQRFLFRSVIWHSASSQVSEKGELYKQTQGKIISSGYLSSITCCKGTSKGAGAGPVVAQSSTGALVGVVDWRIV